MGFYNHLISDLGYTLKQRLGQSLCAVFLVYSEGKESVMKMPFITENYTREGLSYQSEHIKRELEVLNSSRGVVGIPQNPFLRDSLNNRLRKSAKLTKQDNTSKIILKLAEKNLSDFCILERNYIPGKSLASGGKIRRGMNRGILYRAVAHLHSKGFVDLEINADNIIVDQEERPWIVDLGFALKDPPQDELNESAERDYQRLREISKC